MEQEPFLALGEGLIVEHIRGPNIFFPHFRLSLTLRESSSVNKHKKIC